jgi:class 3 adenylate cyclase
VVPFSVRRNADPVTVVWLLVGLAILAWAVFVFNRLVRLRNQVRSAWADIDVQLYQIDQTHRIRVIEDQYIVVTDLRGFFGLAESHVMTAIEKVLDRLFDLFGRMCREFGGNNRFSSGDSYCLAFSDPDAAIAAVERLYEVWSGLRQRESLPIETTCSTQSSLI